MGDQWEYRLAISEGPLSASQLTNEFGKEGWEMVDVLVWPHGKADPETGAVPDRVWNYFKREKSKVKLVTGDWQQTKGIIADKSSLASNGAMETGTGTDQVGVSKDTPPRKPIPMTRNRKKKGKRK